MIAMPSLVIFIIPVYFAELASKAANLDGKREVLLDPLTLESARVPGPTARDLQELRGEANDISARMEKLEHWMRNQETKKEKESNKAVQENATNISRATASPKQKTTGRWNKLWRGVGNAGRFVRRCVTNLCRN